MQRHIEVVATSFDQKLNAILAIAEAANALGLRGTVDQLRYMFIRWARRLRGESSKGV